MRIWQSYPNLTRYKEIVISVLPLCMLYLATFFLLRPSDDASQLFLALSISPFFIWVSGRDFAAFEIPDLATLGIAALALVFLAWTKPNDLPAHLICGCLALAIFWLIGELYFCRTGIEGLGIGDAKLFGACVLLLGPWHTPGLVLIASLGGIIAHFATSSENRDGVPFGPFLAYATFVLMFLEPLFFQSIS